MIVRRLSDITGTERHVHAPTWHSHRLVVAGDGMGFSLHETVVAEGTETKMWYQNHLEAVYCVGGRATVEDLGTGEIHTIEPGTVYVLDQHDQHLLRVDEELRVVCVFNPPCVGDENHDESGSYPAPPPPASAS